MSSYASDTSVTPEKSRQDIEATLKRYGASAFVFGWDGDTNTHTIMFRVSDRPFRLDLEVPDTTRHPAFLQYVAARKRARLSASGVTLQQAQRQRWRALYLYIRAILEAVESGLMPIEQALLPALLLPNGMTVSQLTTPQIGQFAIEGRLPKLLTRDGEWGAA